MSKIAQPVCQPSQQIEKDYINSLLDSNCSDATNQNASGQDVKEQDVDSLTIQPADVQHDIIDYKKIYQATEIDCKVFNIAGLNIAVPISCIREIVTQQQLLVNENQTSQSAMCAGKIDYKNEIIEVIDIEGLVMNGVSTDDNSNEYKKNSTDIILFKGSSAGFICDALPDKQTILNELVHWRDADSKRLWLAGTVAKMGLVLLDVEGIINLLPENN